MFIQRLRMGGLLSFPPDMEFFELQPLNVLIGPNASGKSNFIEVLELLRATPTDFAAAIRDGGGAQEWLWKGDDRSSPATVEVETGPNMMTDEPLRYRISFNTVGPSSQHHPRGNRGRVSQGSRANLSITLPAGSPRNQHSQEDTTGWINRGDNCSVERALAESIRSRAAKGSGYLSRAIRARVPVSVNPNVPRVDVRSLRCVATAAARRSSGEMAASRLQQSGLGAQPDRTPGWSGIQQASETIFPPVRTNVQSDLRGHRSVLSARIRLRCPGSSNPPFRRNHPIHCYAGDLIEPVASAPGLYGGAGAGIASRRGCHARRPARRSLPADAACGHDPFRRPRVGTDRSAGRHRRLRAARVRHCAAPPRSRKTGQLAGRLSTWRPLADGRAWGQPVRGIAIYMEGGGKGKENRAALRRGMGAFLQPLREAARNKALGWNLVCCGPRDEAFQRFQKCRKQR